LVFAIELQHRASAPKKVGLGVLEIMESKLFEVVVQFEVAELRLPTLVGFIKLCGRVYTRLENISLILTSLSEIKKILNNVKLIVKNVIS